MIWGYPHFRKLPYIYIYIYISADPACSRGSASEEKLPAASARSKSNVTQYRPLPAVAFEPWQLNVRHRQLPAEGPVHPLVPWCFGAAWSSFLAAPESNIRHRQLPAEGPVRPSVPWCFGAAKGRFWRLASWNLELFSCRARKQS